MDWKLATFNVNGIRARINIVLDWIREHQPDVLCLQETKCQDKDFPHGPFKELGYNATIRGQKSYNGVAIISRTEPQKTVDGFNDGLPDDEARLLAVLVDGIWVVNTYIPQGRSPEDPAFQSKLQFYSRLTGLFTSLFRPEDPAIWTGDLNVAPEDIDVYDPVRMAGQIGCHPDEREAFRNTANWGFTDLFRRMHPDEKRFTFWDYRLPSGFKRNLGWRIDHIMVSAPLIDKARTCQVDDEPRGLEKPSDHTVLWADFSL